MCSIGMVRVSSSSPSFWVSFMSNSFFFLQAEKNHLNQGFLEEVENFAAFNREQTYVIAKPLGDSRYSYEHSNALVVLSPKRKLTFIDFSGENDSFEEFVDDFVEDLASISDKYRYKEAIGRPRSWKSELITKIFADETEPFDAWGEESMLHDPAKQRIAELLVSLLTGSINDIERVQADLPTSLLDRVKVSVRPPHLPRAAQIAYSCPRRTTWTRIRFNFF